MARVVLDNLSKSFPGANGETIRAVHCLSLAIEDQELLTLVGPSGCGKTTTLRLIAGLEDAGAGTISIDGQIANLIPPQDRDVTMVFQNLALFPHLTARGNIALPLTLRKFPRSEAAARVKEAADWLGLGDCLDRKPEALSGGQRQRVALGRAIVQKPKLLLLDEPLSNLDAPLRAQLRREVRRLHAHLGATTIFVTHDQAEAMTLGDRVAVMNEGAIQQVAAPHELYRRPANLFVARFIGSPSMNLLRGVCVQLEGSVWFQEQAAGSAGRLLAPLPAELAARFDARRNGELVLGIRAEHLHLHREASSDREPRLVAAVEAVEALGPETHLVLGRGGDGLTVRFIGDAAAEVGQMVCARFDWRDVRFFDAATGKAII